MQGAAIIGNLGHDPELRWTRGGRHVPGSKAVTNLTVYENHPRNPDGSEKPSTRHQVTLWEDLAINAVASLKSGDEVIVVIAKTEPNEYTNSEGVKVVGTTITARTVGLSFRWADIDRVKNRDREDAQGSFTPPELPY